MTIRITLPVGMSFDDWSDQVLQDLASEGLAPISQGEKNWQQWALSVCQIPLVSGNNPPNPLYYDDWQDWANHFTRSVY